MSNTSFFPPTPTDASSLGSANAMLEARKQQLAHLQTLQRQQQQVLASMNQATGGAQQQQASVSRGPSSPFAGYASRDDGYSAGRVRSPPSSPVGSANGSSSTLQQGAPGVSFRIQPPARSMVPVECDYDANPTELYLAVQRKDWERAAARSAAMPSEASTWVSRKESDGKLRWRLLPLHAAIIFRAPERTVGALMYAFAQGAACKDDQGMLPLHLAIRNGCEEEVLRLLLVAYPGSVDVQDRKGRTPLMLALGSKDRNREAYVRALERGPAYWAVAGAAQSGALTPGHLALPGSTTPNPMANLHSPGTPMPGHGQMMMPHQTPNPTVEVALPPTSQTYGRGCSELTSPGGTSSVLAAFRCSPHLPHTGSPMLADATSVVSVAHTAAYSNDPAAASARVVDLEAELTRTQETSQVLVDHVNSLEAQLASRSDTERFLATKIANLDSQLRETSARLDERTAEVESARTGAEEASKTKFEEVEELKVKLEDKKDAELKSYKLTNKERFDLEDRVMTAERDSAASIANAAVLEAQLKKKIETERSLASQVSMLASQLASSAASSSEAVTAYQRTNEALIGENRKLQINVAGLEAKLSTVATALDAMAAEQECIVEAATKHEKTMAACSEANNIIIADTARQETLLEDAAKEREQIVSILMRQAEDAERTMADREKLLEAVRDQETSIDTAARERDEVVTSVNKQREYMDFVMNGELNFLKKTASEDEHLLVKERNVEDLNEKMAEFAQRSKSIEDEAAEEQTTAGEAEAAAVEAAADEEEAAAEVEAVADEEEANGANDNIGEVAVEDVAVDEAKTDLPPAGDETAEMAVQEAVAADPEAAHEAPVDPEEAHNESPADQEEAEDEPVGPAAAKQQEEKARAKLEAVSTEDSADVKPEAESAEEPAEAELGTKNTKDSAESAEEEDSARNWAKELKAQSTEDSGELFVQDCEEYTQDELNAAIQRALERSEGAASMDEDEGETAGNKPDASSETEGSVDDEKVAKADAETDRFFPTADGYETAEEEHH